MKRYVAVAGTIGSGKTSLVTWLVKRYGLVPFYEPNDENPYLADFYRDMKTWAFHSQLFFLSHKLSLHQTLLSSKKPAVIDRTIYEDADLTLSTLPLEHGVEAWGYRLEEKAKRTMLPERLAAAGVRGPMVRRLMTEGSLEIDGRTVRLEDVSLPKPGQVFAFVMDTRLCKNAFELARGADMLVCESTYLHCDADLAHDHGHMTAVEAATIARDAGVRRLVLTHFSQRYTDTEAFVAEARAIHPDSIAARDCDVIPVPRRLEPGTGDMR